MGARDPPLSARRWSACPSSRKGHHTRLPARREHELVHELGRFVAAGSNENLIRLPVANDLGDNPCCLPSHGAGPVDWPPLRVVGARKVQIVTAPMEVSLEERARSVADD